MESEEIVWIAAEEQLPEADARILMCRPGEEMCVGYCANGSWHRYDDDSEWPGVLCWAYVNVPRLIDVICERRRAALDQRERDLAEYERLKQKLGL